MRWLFLILLLLIGCTDNTDEEMRLFISSLGSDGGVTPPTPPTPIANYDYMFVPLYGQSLSLNTASTPTITPSSVNSLRFDVGIGGTPDNTSTLIPLNKANDTCTEMLEVLEAEKPISITSKYVTCASGAGGANYDLLKKGTDPYNKLMANLTELKRIADSEGKTVICPAVGWSHGEAQYYTFPNLSTYHENLAELISDFNTDMKAITGQGEDVYLMVTQVGSHCNYGRYPRIAMEQLDEANANPLIYLSKSMYNTDFVSDLAHGTTQTYALQGVKIGYQIAKSIFYNTQDKNWISIKSHTYSALKSTIVFNVPSGNLVFDTTEVQGGSDALFDNYGFELYDVSESNTSIGATTIAKATPRITSVSITSSDTIEITYDSDPTGSRLTYAINGKGWQDVSGGLDDPNRATGRVNGARGNLRDSAGDSFSWNIYNSSAVLQYDKIHNWCPIFEIEL